MAVVFTIVVDAANTAAAAATAAAVAALLAVSTTLQAPLWRECRHTQLERGSLNSRTYRPRARPR